jgi:hypothetical protein
MVLEEAALPVRSNDHKEPVMTKIVNPGLLAQPATSPRPAWPVDVIETNEFSINHQWVFMRRNSSREVEVMA